MFDAFAGFEPTSRRASPLHRLGEIGTRFGAQRLEVQLPHESWVQLTPRLKTQLKRQLEQALARITRPCFVLELAAFRFAHQAIYPREKTPSSKMTKQRFVGSAPTDRLFQMFKTFPVLARLWSQLICQWCDQIAELLLRFDADRHALSQAFFRRRPVGKIVDLRGGLSDPHNGGRTVMLLQFETGSIIYKPRPGNGEQEWFTFLHWMNARSFRPKLKAAKVLLRDGYCWMDHVESAPVKIAQRRVDFIKGSAE